MIQKVAVMRKNFDGTDWKRAFAEALIALQPDMNPDRADELSDGEYLHARHIEPGIAARRWMVAAAPDSPGGFRADGSIEAPSGRQDTGPASSAA